MSRDITPEQKRRWIEGWKIAGRELEELKTRELRSMTEAQAGAVSDSLLQGLVFPQPPSWRDSYSGLVDQQRIFHSKPAHREPAEGP